MAWVLAAQKRFGDAARHAQLAINLEPSEPRFADALSKYLGRAGDQEGSERAAKLARDLVEQRDDRFVEQQTSQRKRTRRAVGAGVDLVVASTGHFGVVHNLDRTDRILTDRPLDVVPGWATAVEPIHHEGSIVEIYGVGRFRIGPQAHVLHKRLCRGMVWEAPIAALMSELAARCDPEALMIEVGANIGAHTVIMGREHRGTVVAFEPVPDTFASLQENLTLNSLTNVNAIDMACSSLAGRGSMGGAPVNNPGMNKLSVAPRGDTVVTTLDDVARDLGHPVALIKIDVEGHETSVLEGARRVLVADRPAIVCELLRDGVANATDLLDALGYEARSFFRSDWLFVPKAR